MTRTGMKAASLNGTRPPLPSTARRDVLIVCPDKRQREEFAGLFEQHGWKPEGSPECRTGITIAMNHDVVMAVIVVDQKDRYTGALINCTRSRHPEAVICLIGSPAELHLMEIAAEHGVIVLPPTTSPFGLEKIIFRHKPLRQPKKRTSATHIESVRIAIPGKSDDRLITG